MVGRPDKDTLELIAAKIGEIRAEYDPELIILFGSRARGDYFKTSDIDLLIVSSKFEGMEWRRRVSKVFGRWDKKEMLEPLCYTPAEFEERKGELGIVRRAVEEGIIL